MGDHTHAFYGSELLRAGTSAAERVPQLADEIRALTRGLAKRVGAGQLLDPLDVDVRTLVALVEQSGVLLNPPQRRMSSTPS